MFFDIENFLDKYLQETLMGKYRYYDILNIEKEIDHMKLIKGKNTSEVLFLNSFIYLQDASLQSGLELLNKFDILEKENYIINFWNDQISGNRTMLILHFLLKYELSIQKKQKLHIEKILYKHFIFLKDKKNLSLSFNHGIFQLMALACLIEYFKIEEHNYFYKYFDTLQRAMYSKAGVHKENTVQYATSCSRWMKLLSNYIVEKNIPISRIDKALFWDEFCKNSFSHGDGFEGVYKCIKKNSGVYDRISGGYFGYATSLYDFLSVSYNFGHIHKHCDNGSFQLNFSGKKMFIDPGCANNYIYSNYLTYSRVISSAHNMIYSLDNEPYFYSGRTFRSNIVFYKKVEKYIYFVVESNENINVLILRHYILFEESVVIFDVVKTKNPEKIRLNFVIHNECVVKNINNYSFLVDEIYFKCSGLSIKNNKLTKKEESFGKIFHLDDLVESNAEYLTIISKNNITAKKINKQLFIDNEYIDIYTHTPSFQIDGDKLLISKSYSNSVYSEAFYLYYCEKIDKIMYPDVLDKSYIIPKKIRHFLKNKDDEITMREYIIKENRIIETSTLGNFRITSRCIIKGNEVTILWEHDKLPGIIKKVFLYNSFGKCFKIDFVTSKKYKIVFEVGKYSIYERIIFNNEIIASKINGNIVIKRSLK